MEQQTLDYDFDEEAIGFGEPVTPVDIAPAGLSPGEKGSLALVGLGILSLILQWADGPLAGTWIGLLSSMGLIAVGTALTFRFQHSGTSEGIKHDGTWFHSLTARGGLGWIAGIAMTAFYVVIYWYPHLLGEVPGEAPTGLVRVVDPLAILMTGAPASRWFLYGVIYTFAIAVFGVRMWMKYRHNRYHQVRTLSVTFAQGLLAWILPNLLVKFQKPYMEFNGIFPLKQDYLTPSYVDYFLGAGGVGMFLLVWALALTFVATPVLTYYFGKRWYCSWICGCGGLAETLGDPFRQLSSKSTRSWKIERYLIHSVLVLVLVMTVAVWGTSNWNWFGSFSGSLKEWYGFYIGAVFSGVVGVGFYPLLGNRVWCRFGCPQAAILGLIQRVFSRFRITTNGGQCMSCGNCSTYCEMGIDVRAYAQRGENIVRASCVGCGVCAAVCPRGVLKLENGLPGDRFENADQPLKALIESLQSPSIYGYEPWNSCPTDAESPPVSQDT
ncbi:MAG: ferredoxin-type protein NapH [Planctomycetota bacterium]|jgi:ferredoxin-type protein NapH